MVRKCNAVLRVSNGFHLSPERDTVFFDYGNMKPQKPTSPEVKP